MNGSVIVYGADWCPDCVRSKRLLDDRGVEYEWRDVETHPEHAATVVELNAAAGHGSKRRIPTILVGERLLSVPSDQELAIALGFETK